MTGSEIKLKTLDCRNFPDLEPGQIIYVFMYENPYLVEFKFRLNANFDKALFFVSLWCNCPNCETTRHFEVVRDEILDQYVGNFNYNYGDNLLKSKIKGKYPLKEFVVKRNVATFLDAGCIVLKCSKCEALFEVGSEVEVMELAGEKMEEYLKRFHFKTLE